MFYSLSFEALKKSFPMPPKLTHNKSCEEEGVLSVCVSLPVDCVPLYKIGDNEK